MARQGTLFLDEIGEVPLSIQVKLLRTLQEKKFIRLGGAQTLHVDFRLITATNRNLEEEVISGRFRRDLYYRLNVVPIILPPLRERQNDILLLSQYFLDKYKKKHIQPNICLTPEDEKWLITYGWPGNIRELKNIIERAVILSTNSMLNLTNMNINSIPAQLSNQPVEYPDLNMQKYQLTITDLSTLDEVQRKHIALVLEKTKEKISGPGGAAQILDMKPSTLYTRMKKLGMR